MRLQNLRGRRRLSSARIKSATKTRKYEIESRVRFLGRSGGRGRSAASGCGFGPFLRPRVVAVVVVADQLPAVLLRGLLNEERRAALGALLGDRPVPQDEVAVRIIRAAEEDLSAARLPLHDLAPLVAVIRACDAGGLVLDVLTFRIAAAGRELAVPPLLHDEIGSAPRTLLVEKLIGLRRPQTALLGRNQLPRRLAVRIAGP